PLRPGAMGAYLRVGWNGSITRRWDLLLAQERSSDDQYVGYGPGNGTLFFRRLESRPKELRSRAVLTGNVVPRGAEIGLVIQVGYEKSHNFGFIEGNTRNGALARLVLEYRFH